MIHDGLTDCCKEAALSDLEKLSGPSPRRCFFIFISGDITGASSLRNRGKSTKSFGYATDFLRLTECPSLYRSFASHLQVACEPSQEPIRLDGSIIGKFAFEWHLTSFMTLANVFFAEPSTSFRRYRFTLLRSNC